jgi:hypothetical protein
MLRSKTLQAIRIHRSEVGAYPAFQMSSEENPLRVSPLKVPHPRGPKLGTPHAITRILASALPSATGRIVRPSGAGDVHVLGMAPEGQLFPDYWSVHFLSTSVVVAAGAAAAGICR